jgi:hypothetical protein
MKKTRRSLEEFAGCFSGPLQAAATFTEDSALEMPYLVFAAPEWSW